MKKLKGFGECLKGVCIAVAVSLLCVLAFAFALKSFSLPSSCIKPVNQAIKVVAILAGCLFSVKRPLLIVKGALVGVFATVTQYLVYGLISKNLTFGLNFFIDVVFALAIGVVCSVLCSVIKKAERR